MWLGLILALPLAAQSEPQFMEQGVLMLNPSYVQRLPALAISADGNTAYVSTTCYTGCDTGTVHIFTRVKGVWTEASPLNAGTLAHGELGWALDVSADGNTLIVGAQADYQVGTPAPGAAYIWNRSNGVWTRQAALSGGNAAVAVSADGNTALVSGTARIAPAVVNETGTWVYTRSGTAWSLQARLNSTAADAALSADGNTAVVGNAVFTRTNGAWTQQAALSGAGDLVFISADGNTVLLGAGLFTRTNGVWSLVNTLPDATGAAMSADGKVIFATADDWIVPVGYFEGGWVFGSGFWTPASGASLALSSDGSTALAGLLAGTVVLVQPAETRVVVTTAVSGNQVTMTATVTSLNVNLSGTPSGLVGFTDNNALIVPSIGRLDENGVTKYTGTLAPGSHYIRAIFVPIGSFNYVAISDPVPVSIGPDTPAPTSSVHFECSPTAPTVGQTITFTAIVDTANGRVPATGAVRFFDRNTLLGSGSVFNGQARFLTTLAPGAHIISAIYTGDGVYPSAAAPQVGLTVSRLPLALNLRSSTSSTALGQPVTFTAAFTAQAVNGIASPSGTVQFYAGSLTGLFGMMVNRTLIGEARIADGSAALTVTSLPLGQQQVVAVYQGDANWSNGTSNAVTHNVGATLSR